jgi:urea transport system permease protein
MWIAGTRARWGWLALGALVVVMLGRSLPAASDAPDQARLTDWREALNRLVNSDDFNTRQKVYDRLERIGDARLMPTLKAYMYGTLGRHDGQIVLYGQQQQVDGQGQVYPLLDPFTRDPIVGSDGKPVYAESMNNMLRARRRDRQPLMQLRSALALKHPDPAERRQAIIEAGNEADPAKLDILKQMRSQSPGGDNATVLRESIARIELANGDRSTKIAAAKVLGDIGSSAAGRSLREALSTAKDNEDAPLIKALERAIGQVNWHQTMLQWLTYTFTGLSEGSILVLMGLGLAIIFGLMGIINMAHGEFMMAGAMTTYVSAGFFASYMPDYFNWYLILAIPGSFLMAGVIGWLCEVSVVHRLYRRPLDSLLATVGISFVLIQFGRVLFGNNLSVDSPDWLVGVWQVSRDFSLPVNRIYILGVCLTAVALAWFIIRHTRVGLLLRATTQDRETAASLGVSTRLVDSMTFAFGAGLAGLAGNAVVMYDTLGPAMGQDYVVESFLVVVVGGAGNLLGAITAGLGLGFISKYLEPMFAMQPLSLIFPETGAATYSSIAVLLIVIVILQWRPRGLFPAKGRLADG